jgi:predicted NAD/FAD-binding protein
VRIAVVGSGIAGLSTAWLLSNEHQVDIYERADYLGGHTHTVDVELSGRRLAVDTGFMVFNSRTYPNLLGLFSHLGVAAKKSRMSLSVQCGAEEVEWSSNYLVGVFAQTGNLVRPEVWRMLFDIFRLSASADRLLADGEVADLTLGELLDREGYDGAFIRWYLLPMAASIWSTPAEKMLDFPAANFLHFCDNHGLLHVTGKPRWQTVAGGAREYVRKMAVDVSGQIHLNAAITQVRRGSDAVELTLADGLTRSYDQVVLACHADQSLGLLADASPDEAELLGAFPYYDNDVVLHLDESFLPRHKLARASWNYHADECSLSTSGIAVTYDLTALQKLDATQPVMVTVNPPRPVDPALTLQSFVYAHPGFDDTAIRAQARLADIQGVRRTWYAGAWTRYGFHEDGLMSGMAVAEDFGIRAPWAAAPQPATARRALAPEPNPAVGRNRARATGGALRPDKAES